MSMINPYIAGAQTVENAVGAVTDPNQLSQQISNNASAEMAPSATKEEGENIATGIGGSNGTLAQAQQAAQQAGQYEKQVGEPVAANMVQQGQTLQQNANQQFSDSNMALNQAREDTNNAAAGAEQQLSATAQAAIIDPQNYIKNLGVSDRTMTALGMLISGAGSGLTGQPNLANDMLQKSIQRDIAAQQQNFLNQKDLMVANLNMVQNAQTRQQLSTAAMHMAAASVATGVNVAAQAVGMQVAAGTAPQKAAMLSNAMQQTALQNINQYDQIHKVIVSGSDVTKMGPLGLLLNAATKHMKGGPIVNNTESRQRILNDAMDQVQPQFNDVQSTPVAPMSSYSGSMDTDTGSGSPSSNNFLSALGESRK